VDWGGLISFRVTVNALQTINEPIRAFFIFMAFPLCCTAMD
jgi:hypothetical protein